MTTNNATVNSLFSRGDSTPVTHAELESLLGSILGPTPMTFLNDSTATPSTAGASTTVKSYTIPANLLVNPGDSLRITAYGQAANNADTKNVGVTFAGASSGVIGITASQPATWSITTVVTLRTAGASGVQLWYTLASQFTGGAASLTGTTPTITFDPTSIQTFSVITTGTGTAGNVTLNAVIIEVLQ